MGGGGGRGGGRGGEGRGREAGGIKGLIAVVVVDLPDCSRRDGKLGEREKSMPRPQNERQQINNRGLGGSFSGRVCGGRGAWVMLTLRSKGLFGASVFRCMRLAGWLEPARHAAMKHARVKDRFTPRNTTWFSLPYMKCHGDATVGPIPRH